MLSPRPSEPAKSISSSKCPVFPSSVLFFKLFMWSKVMIPIKETKMSRHDDLDLDAFTARLQGPEGGTYCKQHTTTRSTERLMTAPAEPHCSAQQDIDHLVEEHTTAGMRNRRVKLAQELHLWNLHTYPKQLRNLHSCLRRHDQAPAVEQQQMSPTCPRTASVGTRRSSEQHWTCSREPCNLFSASEERGPDRRR